MMDSMEDVQRSNAAVGIIISFAMLVLGFVAGALVGFGLAWIGIL